MPPVAVHGEHDAGEIGLAEENWISQEVQIKLPRM